MEALDLPDQVFSTKCTIGEIMEHEAAKAVFVKYLGDLSEHPMFGMLQGMKFELIASMSPETFSEKDQ